MTVSIVSKRNNRNKRNKRNISATSAQHGKKTEFLNRFGSLITQRNNRNIFTRAPLFNYLAFFKNKKINTELARRKDCSLPNPPQTSASMGGVNEAPCPAQFFLTKTKKIFPMGFKGRNHWIYVRVHLSLFHL